MPKLQNSEVLDEVKKAIANHLGVNIDTIKESSKLVDDLGADSLDLVELTMDL
ncbi:MAG: acyl carrier protein, partial [Athalassotoga sp.]